MNTLLNSVSRRHFLGLTSIMTVKSMAPGRRVFAREAPRAFKIHVTPDAGNRSAAHQLSGLFKDLTRGLILEHRHLQVEYILSSDTGMRMRVEDTVSGQTMETPVRRDLSFKTEEAHRLYAEALRLAVHLAPEEAYLVRALGDYYLSFRRFEEGITSFHELIDAHPQYGLLSFQLGMIYDRADRKQSAYDTFRMVNRLNPDDEVTMYNLGVIALELGHHHEAEYWFLETLARDPEMHAARARLDQLGRHVSGDKIKTTFSLQV